MGYFQNLFDSVNKVNAAGFDPSQESYSSRVGEFQITEEAVGANAVTPTDPTDPNKPPSATPSISKSFTDLGYNDPFEGLVTEEGKINQGQLSYNYNLLKDDPNIGVTPEDYTSFLNREYTDAIDKTFGEGKRYEFRDGVIGFEKPPLPPEPTEPTYRYEKTKGAKNKDVYLRFEEGTADESGQEKYISFKTKDEYDNDLARYKAKKGTTTTVKK